MKINAFERPRWLGGLGTPSNKNDWEDTRAASDFETRFLEEDELSSGLEEIGRLVGNNTRELFVDGDPSSSLLKHLQTHPTDFLTLHELFASASSKMLANLAQVTNRPVQKLVIRRQGFGTTLANIEFIEFSTQTGTSVRWYSTSIDADTATRTSLARILMAYSRLTALTVGELPSHSIASALAPIKEAAIKGPWICQQMFFMPQTASPALADLIKTFAQQTKIQTRLSTQIVRPTDLWSAVSDEWNRVQTSLGSTATLLPLEISKVLGTLSAVRSNPAPTATPGSQNPILDALPQRSARSSDFAPINTNPPSTGFSELLTLEGLKEVGHEPAIVSASTGSHPSGIPQAQSAQQDLPAANAAATTPTKPTTHNDTASPLTKYVDRLMQSPGVETLCVINLANRSCVETRGSTPPSQVMVAETLSILNALGASGRAMELGSSVGEITINFKQSILLIRALPHFPKMIMSAVIAKPASNLTVVRLAMQNLDAAISDANSKNSLVS